MTTRHLRSLARTLSAAATLAALGACASGPSAGEGTVAPASAGPVTVRPTAVPEPEGSSSGDAAVDDTIATTTPRTAAQGEGEGEVSPLDEFLDRGSELLASSFDSATFEREGQIFQEAIARCMIAEGFDYVPYVAPMSFVISYGGTIGIGVGAPSPELSSAEYAAQYGYGVSTEDPGGEDDAVDPNAVIVDAMSVTERVEYYQALYGPRVSLSSEGRPNAELPDDDSSCWAMGSAAVPERAPDPATEAYLAVTDQFASLLDLVHSISDRVALDPRLLAATDEWSRCMAVAGYADFTDLNAPQMQIAERARSVMGEAMDPATADPAELAALRNDEVAMAVADERCRVDYGSVYSAVQDELEQTFVDEHRSELEQYRDAVDAAIGEA